MFSVRRALQLAGACAAAAALILALVPWVFGSPLPMIQIQWREIPDASRVALEQEWQLTEPTRLDGTTWSYVPTDTSTPRLRAIVMHPAVADTNGIQRREFRIADRPPLTPRRGGLIDAPASASRGARGFAYALGGGLSVLLCGWAFLLSPAPSVLARMITTRWLERVSRVRRVRLQADHAGQASYLRQGYGGPPKPSAKAEAGDYVLLFAIAAGLLTFAWRFLTFVGFTNDHYIHIALAQQVLLGDLPVRDFTDVGWPLQYLLTAAAWRVAGDALAVEFAIAAGSFALGAAFSVIVAHRLSGSLFIALVVTAFEVLIFPRSYSYPKVLMYAAAGWTLVKLADRATIGRIVTTAAVIAVAFLFRHDHGVFIGIAAAICLVVAGRGEPLGGAARRIGTLTAVTGALLLPWILFVAMNGGLVAYLQGGIEYSLDEAGATALNGWPAFDVRAPLTSVRNAEAWLFWIFWAVPVLSAGVLAGRILRDVPERWRGERACVAALILLTVLVNVSFLRQSLQVRIPDAVVPIALLAAWMLGLCWTGGWRLRPAPIAARAVAAALLVASFVAVGPIADVRGQYDNTDLRLGVAGVRARAAEMWQLLGTSHPANALPASRYSIALMPFFSYVDRCSTASDRLIVTGEFPEVLVLANRAFAGDGVVLGSWYSSAIHQDRTVALLRTRPALFVLHVGDYAGFRDRFPLVDAYITSAYTPMATVPVEDADPIRILAPTDRPSVATDPETGWPCYRDLANRAANSTASIMLDGSATPFPAMSNAVPWSTDVRMIGSPIVTFTALPNASSLIGIRP